MRKSVDGKGILLKFTRSEFINSTLHGQYFLKNIKYFQKLEQGEKIGIKDPMEGKYVESLNSKDHIVFLRTVGSGKPLFRVPNEILKGMSLSVTPKKLENVAIASFVFLEFDKDFYINPETKEYIIKSSVINELKVEFKERPAVVIPAGEFEDQFRQYDFSNPKFLSVATGKVNYYKNTNFKLDQIKGTMGEIKDICFMKDNFFKSQREYRIVMISDNTSDVLLKMNDISDKCTVLASISQLEEYSFYCGKDTYGYISKNEVKKS